MDNIKQDGEGFNPEASTNAETQQNWSKTNKKAAQRGTQNTRDDAQNSSNTARHGTQNGQDSARNTGSDGASRQTVQSGQRADGNGSYAQNGRYSDQSGSYAQGGQNGTRSGGDATRDGQGAGASREVAQSGQGIQGGAQSASDTARYITQGIGENIAGQAGTTFAQNIAQPSSGGTTRDADHDGGSSRAATGGTGRTGSQRQEDIFSIDEWYTLVQAPLVIGRNIVAVSQGEAAQDAATAAKSLQELLNQSSSNSLIKALGQRLEGLIEAAYAGKGHPFGNVQGGARNPQEARDAALSAGRQVVSILRKASSQDAQAYKQFVYAVAQRAASGGANKGSGGQKHADAEQSLLRDLAGTLELRSC
ncbi:MAG: hypothetical protein J2P37_26970 [Ktedonobacteraceae bacterium]|nr:hypothetical protein [Ktedonobacteraceae bacterium]